MLFLGRKLFGLDMVDSIFHRVLARLWVARTASWAVCSVPLLLALPYARTSLSLAGETAFMSQQVRIECPLNPHCPQCFFLVLCAIYFAGVAAGDTALLTAAAIALMSATSCASKVTFKPFRQPLGRQHPGR